MVRNRYDCLEDGPGLKEGIGMAGTGTSTRKRARRKAAYRRNNQNKWSMFLVSLVVAIIVVVVSIHGIQTLQKTNANKEQIARLNEQIAKEQERTEEIEQERIYRQTKGFYEDTAKDVLGMVYPNETVFKEE